MKTVFKSVLLSFLIAFTTGVLYANEPLSKPYRFKHYNIENGLPGETVRCIIQDTEGFMWLGIESTGLTRFDGKNFDVYSHSHDDSSTISSDYIDDMVEDHNGSLWIATNNGLNRLRINQSLYVTSQSFERFYHKPGDKTSIPHNIVNEVHVDNNGLVWVGTNDGLASVSENGKFTRFSLNSAKEPAVKAICGDSDPNILWIGCNQGLYRVNISTGKFQLWNTNTNPKLLSHNINTLTRDEQGRIWVGSLGTYIFDPDKKDFHHLTKGLKGTPFTGARFSKIISASENQIWLGSYSHGLAVYDSETTGSSIITQDYYNPEGILSNHIRDIYEDKNGLVWVAVKNEGIHIYDRRVETFSYITRSMQGQPGLDHESVVSVLELNDGNILIGTKYTGLTLFNPREKTFEKYLKNSILHQKFANGRIESLMQDSKGDLWVGSLVGLNKYDTQTKKISHYPFDFIQAILEDSEGTIWLGSGSGIFTFDQVGEKFIPFIHEQGQFKTNTTIAEIYEDGQQRLWFALETGGLLRHDLRTGQTQLYENDPADSTSISSNMVRAIYEDDNGTIWFGTKITGLNRLNPTTGKASRVKDSNIPAPNSAFSISEDKNGLLWLSTTSGIYSYDKSEGTFEVYTKEYGLQGDAFIGGSAYQTREGIIFMGGNNGLNYFDPTKIKKKLYIPEIRIKSVESLKHTPADGLIKNNHEFEYDDYISFGFSLIDYSAPQKNSFSYQLQGLDNDWVYSGNTNQVSFANLNPGKYTLRVKGANLDRVWSEKPAEFTFYVRPPWWGTTTAKLLYFLVFLVTLFLGYRFLTYRARKQRELDLLLLQKEQTEKLSQFKLNFYTNISHELRTPLTLILPAIEKITKIKAAPGTIRDLAEYSLRHTQRMVAMLNELLDFRKVESGQVALSLEKKDILHTLSDVYEEFALGAETRELDIRFEAFEEQVICLHDTDVISKIARNLLSNAFKYTKSGGSITLQVKKVAGHKKKFAWSLKKPDSQGGWLRIVVSDTGVGIPENALQHIFNRFYRSEKHHNEYLGSGIGLDMVKSLTELHHGKVSAESQQGEGSKFFIEIPLDGEAYINDTHKRKDTDKINVQSLLQEISQKRKNASSRQREHELKKVLIIEDDLEIQDLLVDILSDHYCIDTATNGQQGIDLAQTNLPDLIVSDVMMPEKDGIAVCSELKANFKTSHIPIVLLTAKSELEHRIKGLEHGADAYIPKPFHIDHLKAEIQNLLNKRQTLKTYYQRKDQIEPSQPEKNSSQSQFLSKCLQIIEANISDPEFGVSKLAQEVGVSRTQLFRKLKDLVGQSPVEFIYSTRLKRASQLLKTRDKSISEVAYMTGFSNPSSFSKAFRKYYGQTPKDFVSKVDSNITE